MDTTMQSTNWIWLPDWTPEDDLRPQIVYFKKALTLDALPKTAEIRISADARYKLYANGVFVQEGPQKGYPDTWYVDTADLAPYLKIGENVIAAEVLRYPERTGERNESLFRTAFPCLFIEDLPGSPLSLSGASGWLCRRASGIRIIGESTRPAPIHILEEVTADAALQGWKEPGSRDTGFVPASPWSAPAILGFLADAPFHQEPRAIPPMQHEEASFRKVSAVRESGAKTKESLKEEWEKLLAHTGTVEIPANTTQIVELDAGEESCGYPIFQMAGGKGARIRFLKAESYAYPRPPQESPFGLLPSAPQKGDREDAENGVLVGETDTYTAAGSGTGAAPEVYEPFWFRTFRYYQVAVTTREEGMTLLSFSFRTTGYPLDVRASFSCSDESLLPVWGISIRTLRRCMHETYVDCPYYEQLQYAMDSRQEILYTYLTSADDRLARQCMDAFRRSQRPDGMINSCYPSVGTNVTPGFSIYYILMVWDHMMYFGDQKLVEDHIDAIDGILRFFDRHLTEKGLVGNVGGALFRNRYWSFIDWAKAWNAGAGVPTAKNQGDGSLTMESLLYLYGLQKAADLASYLGRQSTADAYTRRAEFLSASLQKYCRGTAKSGVSLFQDGPGVDEYSVHCQVFAILTGLVGRREGRAMLEETVGNPAYPQASVSFSFYLFLALERIGWMEKADALWDTWRQMVRDHLTTCVENDTDARSDCHAWGSCLLYVFPAIYLGVHPAAPGFAKVSIRPQPGHLTSAEGEVATKFGPIHVAWTRQGDSLDLRCILPDGIEEA